MENPEDDGLNRLYQYILARNGEDVSVRELQQLMESSSATIRRQLAELENRRLVVRTHGGVRGVNSLQWLMRSFEERVGYQSLEKQAIAAAVAEHIRPGMSIAMDGGTTTWTLARHIAQHLPTIELTVATNSLVIVQELARLESIELITIGGRFRRQQLDFVGPAALQQLANTRSELAFISCDGVLPSRGVYGLTEDGTAISAALVNHADKRILLADSAKIGAYGGYKVTGLEAIDYWYTGSLDKATIEAIPPQTRCIQVTAPVVE